MKFTSSKIQALTTNGRVKGEVGKPFNTYVKNVKMERKLKRRLDAPMWSKPTSWGNLCELYLYSEMLSLNYQPCHNVSIQHPTIECYSGTPDAVNHVENTVVDIKSPYTMRSFCTFAECDSIDDVRNMHDDGEKYYWQLVSNAILTGKDKAELIIYTPTEEEMPKLFEFVQELNDPDFNWILNEPMDRLPFIPKGSEYANVLYFIFRVPQVDKDLLLERINLAATLL
jgi:hypothetical protein